MKKFTKGLAIILSCIMVFNTMNVTAFAEETEPYGSTYVDGIRYNVTVDSDYNIIIEAETDQSSGCMILDKNLTGVVNIECDNNTESYEIEISSLQLDEADFATEYLTEGIQYSQIEVLIEDEDNEKLVYCDNIEDIIADEYTGQAAEVVTIKVVEGVITITGMLTALLQLAIVVVVVGVVCYAVDAIIAKIKEKCKQYYYKAYIAANTVVIDPNPISLNSAVSRIKSGLNVYTYTRSKAKNVMDATYQPYYGPEHHWKNGKEGFFFNHYHLLSHTMGKNDAHMLYGVPVNS